MKILFVVYDNESFLTYFPMGIAYLVSAAIKAGYEVGVYDQNIYHLPEAHLVEYLKKHRFDVVGVGMVAGYHQYKKLLKISKAINSSPNRPFYVLGGYMPSPDPEFFLKKMNADAVVIGEGEVSFVNLLKALSSNRSLSTVKGIAYKEGDSIVTNEREKPIENINDIDFPSWDSFNMEYYTLLRNPEIKRTQRCLQVVASRGCKFSCTFCYRMDEGLRIRSPENIIEELKKLKTDYHVDYIEFTDEMLASSEKKMANFAEALLKSGLNIKFYINGRLNYASLGLLKLLKKAGCVYINYGIESLDPKVLKNIKKGLTTGQIIRGIENTIKAGIHPGFNIIFGNVGDNKDTLKKSVDFLLKYNTYAELRTIRPVTPYPGCPLFYDAIKKGLLKDTQDFYENKHKNSDLLSVNFTELSDEEFYQSLFEVNEILIKDYFDKLTIGNINDFKRLYFDKDFSFRGPRQT